MRSHYQIKQRPALQLNGATYTGLTLILMSLTFIAIAPLLRQPIPLHELAFIKNKASTVPIIISIKKNGAYHLNTEMASSETMSLESIKRILNKQFKIIDPKTVSFCIKVDAAVSYGQVAKVIDWIEALGVQHIGLIKTNAS